MPAIPGPKRGQTPSEERDSSDQFAASLRVPGELRLSGAAMKNLKHPATILATFALFVAWEAEPRSQRARLREAARQPLSSGMEADGPGDLEPPREQGPQGPVGLQGLPGPQGPEGATAQTGPIGPIGPTGPIGPIGPAGTLAPRGQSAPPAIPARKVRPAPRGRREPPARPAREGCKARPGLRARRGLRGRARPTRSRRRWAWSPGPRSRSDLDQHHRLLRLDPRRGGLAQPGRHHQLARRTRGH